MCEGVIHWKGVIMRDSCQFPPQEKQTWRLALANLRHQLKDISICEFGGCKSKHSTKL